MSEYTPTPTDNGILHLEPIHSNYQALRFDIASLPEVNNAILGSPVSSLLNEHDDENIKYFFISHRKTLSSFSISCLTSGLALFSFKLYSNHTSISVNLMAFITFFNSSPSVFCPASP